MTPPKKKVIVSLDPCKIKELDEIRGIIPRSAYVRMLIENHLDIIYDKIHQEAEAEFKAIVSDIEAGKTTLEDVKRSRGIRGVL